MSKINWLEKAFCKPKAGKRLARSVMVTVVVLCATNSPPTRELH
jgi:hypothetical protein